MAEKTSISLTPAEAAAVEWLKKNRVGGFNLSRAVGKVIRDEAERLGWKGGAR